MSEAATPRDRIVLELCAVPESLDTTQDELATLWAEHPTVSATDRFRFETAVVEILGNIVEHAYRNDAEAQSEGTRLLRVELRIAPDRLTAELGDNGVPAGLDLSAITMPDAEAESGRGLAIALAALDDLSYRRDGDSNLWSLVCLRHDD